MPATTIKRLLAERPAVKGLAVRGMPIGSPGMEVEGAEPETYDVIAFGPTDSPATPASRVRSQPSGSTLTLGARG